MKKFMKSLAVVLALILAMTLSIAVLADESSDATETSSVSDASSETSATSSEASSTSSEASATSSEASTEASKEASTETSEATDEAAAPSNFPWVRVITLAAIVLFVLILFILAKTKTKLGLKIAKFFKEYWSEIKKVSWFSVKDTAKATGIVLVFLIVAAAVIGVLDLGFTQLIKLLATIFN